MSLPSDEDLKQMADELKSATGELDQSIGKSVARLLDIEVPRDRLTFIREEFALVADENHLIGASHAHDALADSFLDENVWAPITANREVLQRASRLEREKATRYRRYADQLHALKQEARRLLG